MRSQSLFFLLCAIFLWPRPLRSQEPGPQVTSTPLQASNILNPNISVVGWFQGEIGHKGESGEKEASPAMQFKEAEVAFQSVVDPYARADIFTAVEGEGGVELEEAYLTWFHLPRDMAVKVGKFKASLGKFNLTHRPETSFADRPLVHEAFFGEEGLASVGGSLSWHVPNPWLFINLDAEALTMPEAGETPAFDAAEREDLLYIGRLSAYYDLSESFNVTLGASFASGTAGLVLAGEDSSPITLRSEVYGPDITFRWKDPRRAIYRSFLWQTEVLWNRRENSPSSSLTRMGFFSHLEYQFSRRWRIGGRYDWSEFPAADTSHESGGLLYLTFTPSEFSLISLQGKRIEGAGGSAQTLGFLKVTFNIGPHGAHPF